jgi:hypothetical protein
MLDKMNKTAMARSIRVRFRLAATTVGSGVSLLEKYNNADFEEKCAVLGVLFDRFL